MNRETILGIDLGGTNVRGGIVSNNQLSGFHSERIHARNTSEEVLNELFHFTEKLITNEVRGIGIGVPGLEENGIVYDVVNIPAWKEIPLRFLMEERFKVPVLINNDANCFALGEFYFGKGKGHSSMIGLAVGTGLGAGIIINNKLYAGSNCGAGEFGMIEYLDQYYEYYASGQYFQNVYKTDGEEVYKLALTGDDAAKKMYAEMGMHLGNAIKTILYAYDVDLIVLGGWARNAFTFFEQAMWTRINTFTFKRSAKRLKVEVSDLHHSGLLGAASLFYNKEAI